MEEKSTLNYLHEYTCKVLHAKGLALHLVKKSSLYQNQVSNFLLQHHPNATPTEVQVFLYTCLSNFFVVIADFTTLVTIAKLVTYLFWKNGEWNNHTKVTQYYEATPEMKVPVAVNHTKKTHLSRCTI